MKDDYKTISFSVPKEIKEYIVNSARKKNMNYRDYLFQKMMKSLNIVYTPEAYKIFKK